MKTCVLVAALLSAGCGGAADAPDARPVVPSIASAPALVSHGQSVTISGSGFGAKPRAAPAVWDDGSGDNPLDRWDTVYPYTNDVPFRFGYRMPSQVTLANGSNGGIALPHGHVQRYLCGAHYNSGNLDAYSGANVAAVKNGQEGNIYTYVSYYRAIDPRWHTNTNCAAGEEWMCDHNFKEYDYAEGEGIYGDMTNNIYFGSGAGSGLFDSVVWGGNYLEGMNLAIHSVNTDFMSWYPEYGTVFSSVGVPGAGQGWQKVELVLKHASDDGFHRIYQDNTLAWDVSLNDDRLAPGPRVETVFGGYSREYGDTEVYKNNWRYYADVYYDHSFARVMLANDADYAQATIVEPQVPSAWANDSITFAVNLGRLSDSGTAYLFVFNGSNVRSKVGHPVTLGVSGGVRPAVPAGIVGR
jgi:hypothetical protein